MNENSGWQPIATLPNTNSPHIVCCVCGKPRGIFSPACAECAASLPSPPNRKDTL